MLKLFFRLAPLIFSAQLYGSEATSTQLIPITGITFIGLERSQESWIRDYIALPTPTAASPTLIDQSTLVALRKRLLTTGVFSTVDVSVHEQQLLVTVKEKWTTIPVFRGAYGGGTPLTVAGIYDTHAFGSLWTVGTEMRRYGNAPPGGVAWIRAPRWRDGRYTLGFEAWKDNRLRYVYDEQLRPTRILDFRRSYGRSYLYVPVNGATPNGSSVIQVGFDLRYGAAEPLWNRPYDESEINLDNPAEFPAEDRLYEGTLLAKLIYDNVVLDSYTLEGTRMIAGLGVLQHGSEKYGLSELEWFNYQLHGTRFNLALHAWLGATSSRHLSNTFYLGGFDSIRGYPDSYLAGSYAAYMNIEERIAITSWRFMWLQGLAFYDFGSAIHTLEQSSRRTEQSMGFGIRAGIPQIYRLVFRLDYAWSLVESRARGFSFGLNQFIDPYRPL